MAPPRSVGLWWSGIVVVSFQIDAPDCCREDAQLRYAPHVISKHQVRLVLDIADAVRGRAAGAMAAAGGAGAAAGEPPLLEVTMMITRRILRMISPVHAAPRWWNRYARSSFLLEWDPSADALAKAKTLATGGDGTGGKENNGEADAAAVAKEVEKEASACRFPRARPPRPPSGWRRISQWEAGVNVRTPAPVGGGAAFTVGGQPMSIKCVCVCAFTDAPREARRAHRRRRPRRERAARAPAAAVARRGAGRARGERGEHPRRQGK